MLRSGKEEERQMFQQMQAMAQKQVLICIIVSIFRLCCHFDTRLDQSSVFAYQHC